MIWTYDQMQIDTLYRQTSLDLIEFPKIMSIAKRISGLYEKWLCAFQASIVINIITYSFINFAKLFDDRN